MDSMELNKIREIKKISYNTLENMTGIKKSTLQRYLAGATKKIPHDALVAIGMALGVRVGVESGFCELPVLGLVKGGLPMTAEQTIIDYETVPQQMMESGDYFALKISGNSMSPRINDGDTVIVKRQNEVKNGEVAVIAVGADEATCKKVYYHDGGITLISNNGEYPPMFYDEKQVKKMPVSVIGKVVELRARCNF